MGSIRFLGRARGGRCVFCHDSLSGQVQTCPECSATWHPDCGQHAPRCPSVGCSGPAPREASRPTPRKPFKPRKVSAPPPWGPYEPAVAPDLDTDRPRPAPVARHELYTRLLLSGLGSLAIVLVAGAYPVCVGLYWTRFWHFLSTVGDLRIHLLAAMFLAFALLIMFFPTIWLLRLPWVLRKVSLLLADTRPTAMRLSVGGSLATIVGAGTTLTIPLTDYISPAWLRQHTSDRPVLVYGLPLPGPYVVEFEDGALALVDPD